MTNRTNAIKSPLRGGVVGAKPKTQDGPVLQPAVWNIPANRRQSDWSFRFGKTIALICVLVGFYDYHTAQRQKNAKTAGESVNFTALERPEKQIDKKLLTSWIDIGVKCTNEYKVCNTLPSLTPK